MPHVMEPAVTKQQPLRLMQRRIALQSVPNSSMITFALLLLIVSVQGF